MRYFIIAGLILIAFYLAYQGDKLKEELRKEKVKSTVYSWAILQSIQKFKPQKQKELWDNLQNKIEEGQGNKEITLEILDGSNQKTAPDKERP